MIAAPSAQAAAADVFDPFDVQVTPDGYVTVTETIVLRFGSSSGRHGLERTLITREPDPTRRQDVVYPIDYISVESPTRESRRAWITRRIGPRNLPADPGGRRRSTVAAPTATYA